MVQRIWQSNDIPPLNWLTSIYLWRHLFTTHTTHQWRQIDMHSETIAWRANETFPWLPWWVTKEMTKIFRNYWSSPLYLRPRVVKMRSACAPSGPSAQTSHRLRKNNEITIDNLEQSRLGMIISQQILASYGFSCFFPWTCYNHRRI